MVHYDPVLDDWADDLDHLIDSRYGYKVKMLANTVYPRPLVTNEFVRGSFYNPGSRMILKAREPGTQYREIMVGVFWGQWSSCS